MQTINTEQTRSLLNDSDREVQLVNVLSSEQFRKEHIPGSVNIPVGSDDFLDKMQKQVDSKDEPVVVYCASTDCDASPMAAKKLEDAGFSNIYDYEGGTKAWKEAGLPIESS